MRLIGGLSRTCPSSRAMAGAACSASRMTACCLAAATPVIPTARSEKRENELPPHELPEIHRKAVKGAPGSTH